MRLLIIPILFLTAIVASAQATMEATASDGRKVILKSNGTWEWSTSNTTATPQTVTSPNTPTVTDKIVQNVTMEKVSLFYDDYLYSTIKFESAWIGELKELSPNPKIFTVEVISKDKTTFYYNPIPNILSFIVEEDLARQIQGEREEVYKERPSVAQAKPPLGANIYVKTNKRTAYKMVVISCIEFLGTQYSPGKRAEIVIKRKIGSCS